jgi:hypothetical protein
MPTESGASTATSTAVYFPAPGLEEPRDAQELHDQQRFAWKWVHQTLPDDYYFDLRIWSEAEDSMPPGSRRGAVAPTKGLEAEVKMSGVPAIAHHGPGTYYWSVVVVHKSCKDAHCVPRIAGDWAAQRRFTYTEAGRDPTSVPARFPAPALLEPQNGATLQGAQRFAWQWSYAPLPDDYYFDLRIWSKEDDGQPESSRLGAARPTKRTEVEVRLPNVPAIQEHGEYDSGTYYWSVVVLYVPCADFSCAREIAGGWAAKRSFRYDPPPPPP